MREERTTIEKNQTWTLVCKPPNKDAIGLKWVYKVKQDDTGNLIEHKVHLVAKGYTQREGEDYSETFALVARMTTIRFILSTAAKHNYLIWHLDVKSAFPNNQLNEEVYVSQPKGFEIRGEEEKAYMLHKDLYGLKQAPRSWHSNIDRYFLREGFNRSSNELTLYMKALKTDILIISLYVDDIIITGSSVQNLTTFKNCMMREYEMSDMGALTYFLGMQVDCIDGNYYLYQETYIQTVLKCFRFDNCNPSFTSMSIGEKMRRSRADREEGA